MLCPKCGGKNKVINSRCNEEVVCRKRKCDDCGHIFFTEEYEALSSGLFYEVARENDKRVRRKKRARWKHIKLKRDRHPMTYRVKGNAK